MTITIVSLVDNKKSLNFCP